MSDPFTTNPDGWVTGSIPDAEDYAVAYYAFIKSAEPGKPDHLQVWAAVDAIWQRAVAQGRQLVAIEAEHKDLILAQRSAETHDSDHLSDGAWVDNGG
jgi:hypothetical protein